MKIRMLPAMLAALAVLPIAHASPERMKTESFDADPGWKGVNNRSARENEPVTIRQDFGYRSSAKAGGKAGEIGGFVMPAGEPAYYAKVIERKTFGDSLSASGTFASLDGGYNLLLGFFNSASLNEWRTPSTIAIRLNGRGDHFFAYVEYCTSKWRAGGDTTPFPSVTDPATGRWNLIGFPSGGKVHRWTLTYDPQGNGGKGLVTATINDAKALCKLDDGHKADGASFDRFGILNVVKSFDTGGEAYFDDLTINGQTESFDADPKWDGKDNLRTYQSRVVRPRFDFGWSSTQLAGGKGLGELGGMIFRGDCRYPEKMAAYGDAVGPLTLDKPLRASGKVTLTRGVTDSTTLFGFYNSRESLRHTESQSDSIPESVIGIHIEGPSSEGFLFYPVYRASQGNGRSAPVREGPPILPDGSRHDWTLSYDPSAAGGRGRLTISLDGKTVGVDLDEGVRSSPTRLDRFGIVTSWIDGNRQDVYWDDVTYTFEQ